MASPLGNPTASAERWISIDVLRGFALLGILIMNVQSFAMIEAAYLNPTALGALRGADHWVWLLGHLLADQKFMTLFSVLFGAGIAMMAERAHSNGRSGAGLHYRRMGVLLLIGLVHAYAIWFGDILVAYALCGMAAFPFRRCSPWLLLTLGALALTIPATISWFFGVTMPYWPPEDLLQLEQDYWSPTPERIKEEIAVYRGPWVAQLPHRAESAFFLQSFGFVTAIAWRVGGLMLLGMAFWKWRLLTAERSVALYATLLVALIPGLLLTLYGVQRNDAEGWSITYSFFLGSLYNYWGSLLVSLGYLAGVMLACKANRLPWLMKPLAAVGRMALTNYLLHSVIGTLIFYGHGLGQFARFSRTEQFVLVLAVWAAQLIGSSLWLKRFRFGPCEWLWRSLSYGRWQPMLRGSAASAAPT